MKRPTFTLAPIYSAGPQTRDGHVLRDTPCCLCEGPIVKGDVIAKAPFGWEHVRCAEDTMSGAPAPTAWLALAKDAARRPRDYKIGQLRQILASVIDIAFGADREHDEAFIKALHFAHERRYADVLAECVGSNDPWTFAHRWAEGDWSDENTPDGRLPFDEAYDRMWRESVDELALQLATGDGPA